MGRTEEGALDTGERVVHTTHPKKWHGGWLLAWLKRHLWGRPLLLASAGCILLAMALNAQGLYPHLQLDLPHRRPSWTCQRQFHHLMQSHMRHDDLAAATAMQDRQGRLAQGQRRRGDR